MRPQIVCHRGANAHAPENTYASAQLCIDWGMDYVEIDVSRSRDGVHYLMHGPEVDRTTNGRGRIADLISAEIDALDAGTWFDAKFAQERVPRLDEFLGWIAGKAGVFFDVKSGDLAEIIGLVYKHGLQDSCFFWFGKDEDALHFRKLDQKLPLKMNVKTVADCIRADEIFGANIVEVGLEHISHAMIAECRRRNMKVMIYYQGKEEAAFEQMLAWGVEMVNVNHGDLFTRVAERYQPQLAETSASLTGTPAMRRRAQRAILFLLDGCRPDAILATETPNIRALMERGAWTMRAQTVMPSITLPCHTSLFFSCRPERHGVLTNDWKAIEPPIASLFEVVSDAGYSTAAFYTWEQLRDLAAPGALDTVYYRRLSEEGFAEVMGAAAMTIARIKPTFSFVYVEATDAIGHRYGWMSDEYMEAVRRADQSVGAVINGLAEVGALEDTLIVVMADHGGHEHRHGTTMAEDMTIPWIAAGPGIRQGYEIQGTVSIVDVAPTLAHCLGLEHAEGWEGAVIAEALQPVEELA